MSSKRPQDLRLFRPYSDEWPWHFFEDCPEIVPPDDLDLLRLAKLDEELVGLYALSRLDSASYRLDLLFVAGAERRQGFGRWLLGHAVGLAETKGGRRIHYAGGQSLEFFRRFGFAADANGLRYDLIPE